MFLGAGQDSGLVIAELCWMPHHCPGLFQYANAVTHVKD